MYHYPYGIFNINALKTSNLEVNKEYIEIEQQKNIANMVKAISDYCNAARKVIPEYRQQAFNLCSLEILRQMSLDDKKF